MHFTSLFKHIFSLAVIVTTLNLSPLSYNFKYASCATVLVIVFAVKYTIFSPLFSPILFSAGKIVDIVFPIPVGA